MSSATEIKVPELGESVSEATIAQWVKKAGDYVEADETILELETDKVTLEVNAPANGTLVELKVDEGDVVEVGDIIGLFDTSKKDGGAQSVSQNAKRTQAEQQTDTNLSDANLSVSQVGDNGSWQNSENRSGPAAKKLALEKGVNLAHVQGSAKEGRATKADVINFSQAQQNEGITPDARNPAPTDAQNPAPIDFADNKDITLSQSAPREERVKMTRLRKTIASRLKHAQDTAAMLTTFNEIDMSAVMLTRKTYKETFEERHQVKLGFMSFFVKACVSALKEIPAVNAEIDQDDIVYKNHYDIGVAVSTPNGLVVPVVKDADQLSFANVEKTIGDLGRRGRDGKLSMKELQGGTFTITNGGIFGSLMSTPILNPPQSGILGMHKIQERPVVVNGEIKVRPLMYVALTYDHRIIDGREAVTFLVRVKECIENPERLLLEV